MNFSSGRRTSSPTTEPLHCGLRRFGGLVRSPNAPLKVPLTIQWHHVVLDRLDQPETLQLMEFVEVSLDRSLDWIHSELPSLPSHKSSSKAGSAAVKAC